MIPPRLHALAAELGERLAQVADVEVNGEGEWPHVDVQPFAPGAESFSWTDGGSWLIFDVGHHCAWELDENDDATVRSMAEADDR